jgi:hypothetical protein
VLNNLYDTVKVKLMIDCDQNNREIGSGFDVKKEKKKGGGGSYVRFLNASMPPR